jgi:ribosomal protein S27E
MSDIINCPQCERKLQVPETLVGQDVKCPSCGATFAAPLGGSQPVPPPNVESVENQPPSIQRESERHWDREDAEGHDYDERSHRRRRRKDIEPHRGTLILVLGILGLVFSGFIVFGPIAWILGNNDLVAIRAGRMDPDGEGLTSAGRICGIIGTALSAFSLMCCVAYILFIVATIGMSGGPPPRKF